MLVGMGSRGRRRLGIVATALMASALLSSCGSDDTAEDPAASGPSASPTVASTPTADAPDLPACAEVWQEGGTLPRSYDGCAEDGESVERDVVRCSSGQTMVRYADRFYGVLGGKIHQTEGPLSEDRAYRRAVRSCTA